QIYQAVVKILESTYYIGLVETPASAGSGNPVLPLAPQTVAEAIKRLISELTLKDKAIIANMTEMELTTLRPSLGEYVKNKFGLGSGNEALMASCRTVSSAERMAEDAASMIVIRELWKHLRKTHKLRVIK
ncbi:MAG: hypothetical protein JSW39_06225, partial [Desulfobacterales bacterium]